MNNKSNLLKIAAVLICLFGVNFSVSAQKRKPAPRKPVVNAKTEIKNGAEKVSIQLKNTAQFVYLLGGIARTIEDTDKDAKAGKLNKTIIDRNNQYKQVVIQSIKNLQTGIAALEIEFRTKPALKPYLVNIQGVTGVFGEAEELAENGQFTQSGKTILSVIEKLTDTLAAMP